MTTGQTSTVRGNTAGLHPSICFGCGKTYIPARLTQVRCRPNCGRSRHSEAKRTQQDKNRARCRSRAGPKTFIGIDGEGVTDPLTGEHRYVLLSCGDKHIAADGAHLTFDEIMNFLWSCFLENRSAVYVGFYLKYDWSQWLRSLPASEAVKLLDPVIIATKRKMRSNPHNLWPVTYAGWDFDYLYGRRFKLRPHRPRGEKQFPYMWINDAGSYFQCSFLRAIDPRGNPNPVVSEEEYRIIEKGKERRNHAEYDPAMVQYNQLECAALARLMSQLEEGMRAEELRCHRAQWFGPGQLSQKWLAKIKAPKGSKLREIVPPEVRDAARGSYTAGWFELFWHGPVPGEQYGYDVNSAYPFVMSRLPCLLHGEWSHHAEKPAGRLLNWAEKARLGEGLSFVRARLEGSHPVVGTMRHRLPGKQILRPWLTEGWFVGSELDAAISAAFVDKVRLFERWSFRQDCDCDSPLRGIADLYAGRLLVKKNSPQGKAKKLVYNSVAGKFQQSVGQPVFANPVYATLITAGCRELMTRAIASHPGGAHDLLMVATDSLTFRTPHTGLEMDRERLGAWTGHRHENLSLLMSGIYWDDEARRGIAAGKTPVFKSRGIAAKDLAARIADLDLAWQRFDHDGWPTLRLPMAFQLVSPKQALDRGKWDMCGTVISYDNPETWPLGGDKQPRKPERVVTSNPGLHRRADGPGRSQPHKAAPDIVSLAYDGTFGDELREVQDNEFGDNPDGPAANLLTEAIMDH